VVDDTVIDTEGRSDRCCALLFDQRIECLSWLDEKERAKGESLKENRGMAKRQIQVSKEEDEAVAAAERATRNTDELKRRQAVREYGSGLVRECRWARVGCLERTSRAWVHRYHEGGLKGCG
jgi:hypothetical protein